MAEGLVNAYFKEYRAFSAGTEKTMLNPFAINAMQKIGIDISHHHSKLVDEFKNEYFDVVITVCDSARQSCPFYPNTGKVIHKGFIDPSGIEGNYETVLKSIEITRDMIKDWLDSFL
jgi:arsenate reductase